MKIKIFQIRLGEGYLQNDQDSLNAFLETVTLKKSATQLITGKINFWSTILFYEDRTEKATKNKTSDKFSFSPVSDLTEEEARIFEVLKQWRFDKACEFKMPSYLISSNSELVTISKTKPRTPDDLIKVKGFGPQKVAKYGGDIIALLNSV